MSQWFVVNVTVGANSTSNIGRIMKYKCPVTYLKLVLIQMPYDVRIFILKQKMVVIPANVHSGNRRSDMKCYGWNNTNHLQGNRLVPDLSTTSWQWFVWLLKWGRPHDGVMTRTHFRCHWPFVRGIHRSPVNSPHRGQVMWSYDIYLGSLKKLLNKQNCWTNRWVTGDFRHHDLHVSL